MNLTWKFWSFSLEIEKGSVNKHGEPWQQKKKEHIKWRCACMKLFLFGVGTNDIGPHLVGTYKMCNSWKLRRTIWLVLPHPSLDIHKLKPHCWKFWEWIDQNIVPKIIFGYLSKPRMLMLSCNARNALPTIGALTCIYLMLWEWKRCKSSMFQAE